VVYVQRVANTSFMNKKAVLDLGTNTFHLLIAEISEAKIKPVVQETIAVKLGEGGINKGMITDAAFERGVEAVIKFAETIKQHGSVDVRAIGTAALRSASNGMEFVHRIKEETGISIQIIDGDLEAKLIYEGVRHGVTITEKTALIMDIGGGSVEFILANAENIFWKRSYPVGAARLMERYHKSDPITTEEINQIHQHLSSELTELKQMCAVHQPETLIGSAGAFETFAALAVAFFNLPESLLTETEFRFDLEQYNYLSEWIVSSTHTERAVRPEIIPVRVDMIVVATVLTDYILKEIRIAKLKLSSYALKEGLLFNKQ
jgi:exopolyphosphatase / guanosine-5'-triphosphate,3'-diphosphate pyrophosphatase